MIFLYVIDDFHKQYVVYKIQSVKDGNGHITTYAQDGLTASLNHDAAGTADDLNLSFEFNPAGQMTSKTRSNTSYDWDTELPREAMRGGGVQALSASAQGASLQSIHRIDCGRYARGNLTAPKSAQ